MVRMGKKQELVRNFRLLTSIAFTSCVMGTWEILLTSNTPALTAGGLAGLWWQCKQTAVLLSPGEMASMAPTAGGQYHWVSEFALPRAQKPLSYTSGWLSTTAWQSFIAVDSFICAALIQPCISLNDPTYTTLLMIALVCGMGTFNIFLAQWLAIIEAFFAILHHVAWIPIIVILWVMTPQKQSSKTIFTEFTDNGAGWENIGITVCVGQVGAMFTAVGSDASAHMAEEIRDAGVTVPRSMWYFICNKGLTLIVLVTYCSCIGDLATTPEAANGFPFVEVFLQSTGSTQAATGLTALISILLLIISTSCMASTSRATFAFARDDGMVASRWISKVSSREKIPVNNVIVTIGFTVVMSLINLGSTTAFNAFLSVSVVALMATYTLSIACILRRRLNDKDPLPTARWRLFGASAPVGSREGDLGKYGVPINAFAMLYSVWSFFWSFRPITRDVAPETVNWAVLIFGSIMIISAIAFVAHARKVYEGSVARVQRSVNVSAE
ncbi:amino acid transporter [Polychaeton citri CBS 116435]|uniref:Amino acid transporter n=1 Tax=Polychaeton citri CBS 116435 TaxID=1314669 RepID=A0A9P4Q5G8_9PEZI|nr:amino acid transporter [Polychaeton citri CBS 116435]